MTLVAFLLALGRGGPHPRVDPVTGRLHRLHGSGEPAAGPGVTFVEVFCRCPADLAGRRYLERGSARHPGHAESDLDDAFDAWISAGQDRPLGLSPVLVVDTSGPVDAGEVARRVLSTEPWKGWTSRNRNETGQGAEPPERA